jgi:hypothetical protein
VTEEDDHVKRESRQAFSEALTLMDSYELEGEAGIRRIVESSELDSAALIMGLCGVADWLTELYGSEKNLSREAVLRVMRNKLIDLDLGDGGLA